MAEPLIDTFGRVHRDLRISVTDRCNFRCGYCMPAEGMEWMPRADLLTYEEIERVARVFVEHFGFDSIRLTGGEPTVRSHLPVLIEKLAPLGADLSLTTNGATLGPIAHDLAAAGPRRPPPLTLAPRPAPRGGGDRPPPPRRSRPGARRHRRGPRRRPQAG